jgi:hypothetical protein
MSQGTSEGIYFAARHPWLGGSTCGTNCIFSCVGSGAKLAEIRHRSRRNDHGYQCIVSLRRCAAHAGSSGRAGSAPTFHTGARPIRSSRTILLPGIFRIAFGGERRRSIARHALRRELRSQPIPRDTLRGTPASVVSISDSGPGIPAENLKEVFDPFFTIKEWELACRSRAPLYRRIWDVSARKIKRRWRGVSLFSAASFIVGGSVAGACAYC